MDFRNRLVYMCNSYREMKHRRRLSIDIISTLPPHIIESILSLLPIKEAARTSILSKEWRYKWTRIPKLEFKSPIFCDIYRVLVMRQAPISEFSISIDMDQTCVELDPILGNLSRNHALKKLKLKLLDDGDDLLYKLPMSFFSFHELTHLYLTQCDLKHQPPSIRFGRLTTLFLKDVCITRRSLLQLLSTCQLLKTLTLLLDEHHIICDDNYTVRDLFQCIPVIENLTTWSFILDHFVVDPVCQEFPTSLIHLKHFSMDYYRDLSLDWLSLLAFLIRCSPNLEKITIKMMEEHFPDEIKSVLAKTYSNIRLDNLKELKIIWFGNLTPDLEFVKFILARSPELKKVHLDLGWGKDNETLVKNEELEIKRSLLHTPPASPVVKIIVS